jgi:TatD DNase family protein
MDLIDSHAHLDFRPFDDDRDAVIARARDAGLVAILNSATSLASSWASVSLAETHDFVCAAVGVHPHGATTATRTVLEQLRALANHPKVVAIGEIGLDYYRDLSPRPAQRRAFADQLALAKEVGLPVIVHSRDAHDDVFALLQDWLSPHKHAGRIERRQGQGVLHSYAAGPERLDEALEMGFYIGISGPVTFKNAGRLQEVAAKVPLDRLLIETDCPYLTPEPHRGERNEPAYVRYVAQAIARIRQVSEETVAQATTDNARWLFGIDD